MPRLQCFDMTVKTGERSCDRTPGFVINGFELEFDNVEGGTEPGDTLTCKGSPDSFPHSLHLTGPEEGTWDISELSITYYPYGEEPYTLRFAPVSIDSDSDLNIWHQKPAAAWDV